MRVRQLRFDMPWGGLAVRTVDARADLPVLLLLHQSPLSARNYDALLPHLAPWCRPYALDTPGYGQSDPPPGQWDVAAYADAVGRVADALGASRFLLFGRATGAVFALEAALRLGERVTRLALHGLPVYTAEERAQRLANFAPPYVPDDAGTHLAWIWARIKSEYPALEPALATRFVADYLAAGPDFATAYRAIFRHDLRARAAGAELPPTLLIAGGRDRIGFMHERAAALFADAESRFLPDADDFVAERDPAGFASHLAEFFAPRLRNFAG